MRSDRIRRVAVAGVTCVVGLAVLLVWRHRSLRRLEQWAVPPRETYSAAPGQPRGCRATDPGPQFVAQVIAHLRDTSAARPLIGHTADGTPVYLAPFDDQAQLARERRS